MAQWHEQRFHEDYRRRGFYDVIPQLLGDMNVTHMNAGVISGMHMHKRQTDYFVVAKGSIMVRLIYEDERPPEKFVLSEHSHRTLIIPPHVWHGYKALEASVLVFYIDRKFSQDDEFRRPTVEDDWEIEIR
jgi:dTDP-4-dehydrorhamnose 3,5-epimerase